MLEVSSGLLDSSEGTYKINITYTYNYISEMIVTYYIKVVQLNKQTPLNIFNLI